MLFTKKRNFGITQRDFLKEATLGYLNLCKVQTDIGYTANDATSIDENKKSAIKKCYSEYLERYSLGINIGSQKSINVFNHTEKKLKSNYLSAFAYGNTITGHNDTTGTAAGLYSDIIINKAVCELVEKNEVFCFWYGNSGKMIDPNNYIKNIISKLNFISTNFFCFCSQEISNYPTIIVLGFLQEHLITTGVSCTDSIYSSLHNAFQEAKIVEWQQFKNPESNYTHFSNTDHKIFWDLMLYKQATLTRCNLDDKIYPKMDFTKWVQDIQVRLIFEDRRLGLKVVKCISNELLSCLPIKKNIACSPNKEIVKRYYLNQSIDCPIV